MAAPFIWITFKNKAILFNDRSNLRDEAIIENINHAKEIITKSEKKDILYLIDNTDTIITPKVKDVIKKAGHELTPYIKKTAVIEPNLAQKILINVLSRMTGMPIKVFKSLDKGKEWLIQ